MLPMLLSKEVQRHITTYPPSFIAGVINKAINEINNGSTERLEVLIRRRL